MRPDTFQQHLLAALALTGAKARPADGRDGSGMACGVVITAPSGGETWWQIAGRLAPGARHDGPLPIPVTGTVPGRHPAPTLPTEGPVPVADIEAVLAAAVARMDDRDQVATVERYSTRDQRPAVGYGLHVECRDGSGVFVQLHWALRPGQDRTVSSRYKAPEAV